MLYRWCNIAFVDGANPCACPLLQVLAVVNKRLAKSLLKRQPDIEKFGRRVEVGRDRIAAWPNDALSVFAEHPSVFYDLMTDQLLNEVRIFLWPRSRPASASADSHILVQRLDAVAL